MFEFFMAGGVFMWLLLILAITIIVLAVKKGIALFGKKEVDVAGLENGINAILFWGIVSAVLGFFAHFLGVYLALNAIARMPKVAPAIVAGGYAVSLHTALFGMVLFYDCSHHLVFPALAFK